MFYLPMGLVIAQLTSNIDVLDEVALVKEQGSQDNDVAWLDLPLVFLALIRLLWCDSLKQMMRRRSRQRAASRHKNEALKF